MHSTKRMRHTCRNNVLLATIPVEYDSERCDARWLVARGALQFTLIRVGHHVGSTHRLRHVDASWSTAVGGTHTLSCLTPCTPLTFHTLAQVWKTPQTHSSTFVMVSTNNIVLMCVIVCAEYMNDALRKIMGKKCGVGIFWTSRVRPANLITTYICLYSIKYLGELVKKSAKAVLHNLLIWKSCEGWWVVVITGLQPHFS